MQNYGCLNSEFELKQISSAQDEEEETKKLTYTA